MAPLRRVIDELVDEFSELKHTIRSGFVWSRFTFVTDGLGQVRFAQANAAVK